MECRGHSENMVGQREGSKAEEGETEKGGGECLCSSYIGNGNEKRLGRKEKDRKGNTGMENRKRESPILTGTKISCSLSLSRTFLAT